MSLVYTDRVSIYGGAAEGGLKHCSLILVTRAACTDGSWRRSGPLSGPPTRQRQMQVSASSDAELAERGWPSRRQEKWRIGTAGRLPGGKEDLRRRRCQHCQRGSRVRLGQADGGPREQQRARIVSGAGCEWARGHLNPQCPLGRQAKRKLRTLDSPLGATGAHTLGESGRSSLH